MCSIGINSVISENAKIGNNVSIGHNCIVEDNVIIENNCRIDHNTIFRYGTKLGSDSFVGSNCIIGEYMNDYILDGKHDDYKLEIGSNALIRSGSIIYSNSEIGEHFQTGHRVTIR